MRFTDFPAWLEAWRELPPMRRAYHLCNLLTGRGQEKLAWTPWNNFDKRTRTLTIGNSKAGNDIPIPLSAAIARCLKLARDNDAERRQAKDSGLIFPGCEQAGGREKLPVRGHALRRTYKTIGTDLKISDELTAFLIGHIPEGMSAKYAMRRMLLEGPTLRGLQKQVSKRMMELLGCDPTMRPVFLICVIIGLG